MAKPEIGVPCHFSRNSELPSAVITLKAGTILFPSHALAVFVGSNGRELFKLWKKFVHCLDVA